MSAATDGPWAVEPMNPGWAVKRPGSSAVFMIRPTEEEASKACDAANQKFREDRVSAAALEMLAVLNRMLLDLETDGHAAAIATLNTRGRAAIAKAEGKS